MHFWTERLGVPLRSSLGNIPSSVLTCTAAKKTMDRQRKAKTYAADCVDRSEIYARVKRSRALKALTGAKLVIPSSARADRAGVLGREGSWKRAADLSARLCQHDDPIHLPPSYAGLDQEANLRLTSEMCGCLEEVQWATCVV